MDKSRLPWRPARTGVLVLGIGLTLAFPAHGFRCGNELVLEGDRKYDVLDKCGEPDFQERHAGAYLEGIGAVGITETWYYNPGSTGLIRILTFRRGALRSIELGARGFSPGSAGKACQPYALDIGMSRYELLSRCGEPVARDSWYTHSGFHFHPRHHFAGPVLVEEWIYDFGPNRFRRYIRIIDGRIVGIHSGGPQ